jgi:hypothetical protein
MIDWLHSFYYRLWGVKFPENQRPRHRLEEFFATRALIAQGWRVPALLTSFVRENQLLVAMYQPLLHSNPLKAAILTALASCGISNVWPVWSIFLFVVRQLSGWDLYSSL